LRDRPRCRHWGKLHGKFHDQRSARVSRGTRALRSRESRWLILVSPWSSYFQVHVLPILIRRPQRLLNFRSILDTLLGILRSASFLSVFVSSFWAAVCFTRTLVVARALPEISHDFYDGPFGCVLAGCMVCGSSIWVESGRRRGEMALYVLPRAIRACLPDRWLRSGRRDVYAIEQFVFSCAGIE
jgi:hypothetical protein